MKHKSVVFFLLALCAGAFIFSGRGDFQPFLSQGDHGRDLYAFKRVMEGAVPYRDFYWLFGPLMAYYYAAFFKVFGVSVQSALLGQNILLLMTGLMFYWTGARFLTPVWGFLCALSYWAFRGNEFFYTYNHSGGILCLVVMMYAVFAYMEQARIRHLAMVCMAGLLLLLIRPNMGVVALVTCAGSLVVTDIWKGKPLPWQRWRVLFYGVFASMLLAAGVYTFLFWGQPVYVLWESFPFSQVQRDDGTTSILAALQYLGTLLKMVFGASLLWTGAGVMILAAVGRVVYKFRGFRPGFKPERAGVLLPLFFLTGMVVLTGHEFLFSGIFYRLFWVFPSALLFVFCVFYEALKGDENRVWRGFLYATVFWLAATTLVGNFQAEKARKVPGQLLARGATHVYTTQDARWFAAVNGACDFIEKNVPQGDKLFTLPSDTLYNFLTGRDQPTRQWSFFEHVIIPEEQQLKTIRDLEAAKVNWVLVSNRAISGEPSLGLLGRDHCQILWKYIDRHYQPAAQFGDWTPRASWAWDHGVIFFKRKDPF